MLAWGYRLECCPTAQRRRGFFLLRRWDASAAARCNASPGARASHASAVARAHTAGRLCAGVDGHVRKSVFGVLCQTGPGAC
eukprot:1275953-Rhodomonas_salina.1